MMLMMILKQLMLDPTALIRAAKQVLAEFGSCCSIDGSGAITFFYTFTAVLDFDIKKHAQFLLLSMLVLGQKIFLGEIRIF